MSLSRRTILSLAFPLALAMLSLNIIVAFASLRTLTTMARQSGRSRDTLNEVEQIIAALREAESSQRGYLLTGSDSYLEPYVEALGLLPGRLDRLKTLTANNPNQTRRVNHLSDLIDQKREELEHSVALFRSGHKNAALKTVKNGRGIRLMDRTRRVASAMREHEQSVLARDRWISRRAFQRTALVVVIATFLAMGLLGLALVLRRRELAERERRALAVRQSEARLATTFLSIGDAVISTDETGCVQLMNPVAEALTGYPLADAVGRPIAMVLQLMNERTRQPAENPVTRVLREGVISGLANHTLLIARDGTRIPIDDSAAPIRDASGQILGVIIVFRDITARRRDESERERLLTAERSALADAENANRAKDQFLAILSHELRTPLNPIMLAVTSMLARPVAPEEIGPALEMIRENVVLEARLIDDLLDVMRIARGKLTLHPTVLDCHSLIRHAVQICQSDVQDKQLGVAVNLSARDHHVSADATRLEQVFWNLIKNAVKFTPTGGTIAIRTWNEPDPTALGRDMLIIEFVDTGIGIEPNVLPWIFDPFHQGEASITRRFGGMGLGLAISLGVIEAHGGVLTAESLGKNQGATFRVQLKVEQQPVLHAKTLPLPGSTATSMTPSSSTTTALDPPPASLRIFLVEDEPMTLIVMARLLRRIGHEVTTASSVQEALTIANGLDFDVVISDIGLPDGSGLDLFRQLSVNRVLPAIALTGFGMQEDIRQSREAGFRAHLTKPIDFARLVTTIRQVVSRPADSG
ncbi:PAS domain S-box-containing protein [Singulisphaera sp. GP187]|uniref:CHASE3 domain-containing protein n=1 Tax=Singulisphaera sp. GP187 TaxID=1882752 RepID=UPI000925C8C2|nr:CHASE3 domain-containing protein [Singulisphaera sp. GP187]SIO26352.1 PAS domain S-box-containing protein [Singulisphaera sp. GP187]